MMFSVAMKGSSWFMRRAMTFGYTTRPSDTFCSVVRTMSAVRNASGKVTRRFALNVKSACFSDFNHSLHGTYRLKFAQTTARWRSSARFDEGPSNALRASRCVHSAWDFACRPWRNSQFDRLRTAPRLPMNRHHFSHMHIGLVGRG